MSKQAAGKTWDAGYTEFWKWLAPSDVHCVRVVCTQEDTMDRYTFSTVQLSVF